MMAPDLMTITNHLLRSITAVMMIECTRIDIPDLTQENKNGKIHLRSNDMHLRMVNHRQGLETSLLARLLMIDLG